ncbi:MAG: DegV family protein [Desulfobacterales bacterium]
MNFQKAFVSGVERIAAWADLLDAINVFPVADGDTGRNLIISLTPLRTLDHHSEKTIKKLLLSARGNSGIIAARFFSGFLTADSLEKIPQAAKLGRDLAWKAVRDPQKGTMLTVFDTLAEITGKKSIEATPECMSELVDHLQKTVYSTTEHLSRLKEAGVIDAGALGMFIYLEGFFNSLIGNVNPFLPLTELFKNRLRISASFEEGEHKHYCIDTVIRSGEDLEEQMKSLSELGDSVVVIPDKDILKIHLHSDDKELVRKKVESFGSLIQWSDEDLEYQIQKFKPNQKEKAIHIITDAAGSVTREDAVNLGMTLLDSYITAGEESMPETFFNPSDLYHMMKSGVRASTSQASEFERHQYYQSALDQYRNVLYLCVGSFYTGNYDIAADWKRKHDPENRFSIIDTGAASGRLGILAIATALYSGKTDDPEKVVNFAQTAVNKCREYIFIDRLKYLAQGGRMSKTGAFFGDVLHMKPVITPTPEGAKKIGLIRNPDDQIKLIVEKLDESIDKKSSALIMVEYTDNREWVSEKVKAEIETRYPASTILLRPLSLTSGVHTGPGTWAVAFIPETI